jgi:hypothetical protein
MLTYLKPVVSRHKGAGDAARRLVAARSEPALGQLRPQKLGACKAWFLYRREQPAHIGKETRMAGDLVDLAERLVRHDCTIWLVRRTS